MSLLARGRAMKVREQLGIFIGGVYPLFQIEQGTHYDEIIKIRRVKWIQNHILLINYHNYYFLVKEFKGKLKLGGPEIDRHNKDNQYNLVWVPIKEIKNLNIYPVIIKEKLLKKFNSQNI